MVDSMIKESLLCYQGEEEIVKMDQRMNGAHTSLMAEHENSGKQMSGKLGLQEHVEITRKM